MNHSINSNGNVESSNNNDEEWTESEMRMFEDVLGESEYKSRSEMFEKIMRIMPWKSLEQIKTYYAKIISNFMINENNNEEIIIPNNFCGDARVAEVEPNKRKGAKWSISEHRAFLEGLDILGKGEWKAISEMFVPNKTTSQVASHAHSYFRRKNSTDNDTPLHKRRFSIHDIRIVNSTIVETFPRKPGTHHSSPNNNNNNNNGRRRIATTVSQGNNNNYNEQANNDAVVGPEHTLALVAAPPIAPAPAPAPPIAPADADLPQQIQIPDDVKIVNWNDLDNIDFDKFMAEMPDFNDIFSAPFL